MFCTHLIKGEKLLSSSIQQPMFAILNGWMGTSSLAECSALRLLNWQNAQPPFHHCQPSSQRQNHCLQLQILSVKPVDCNNFNSVFGLPWRPSGWPRDSDACSDYWVRDACSDYWVRSYRCPVTLLQCKSHWHRVCQQLWMRDKCLVQRLSMHHQIFVFWLQHTFPGQCHTRIRTWANITFYWEQKGANDSANWWWLPFSTTCTWPCHMISSGSIKVSLEFGVEWGGAQPRK
jgi:hypothetical protein